MRIISQGLVNAEKFDLLIELARFESEDVISSLRDYAVKGMAPSVAADINGVKRPNFTKALGLLNQTATKVERCKEIDLRVIRDK